MDPSTASTIIYIFSIWFRLPFSLYIFVREDCWNIFKQISDFLKFYC